MPNKRQPRRVKGSTKLTSTAGLAARLRRVPGERISEGDRRRVHDGKSALGGQVRRAVRVHRGDGAEPLLAHHLHHAGGHRGAALDGFVTSGSVTTG